GGARGRRPSVGGDAAAHGRERAGDVRGARVCCLRAQALQRLRAQPPRRVELRCRFGARRGLPGEPEEPGAAGDVASARLRTRPSKWRPGDASPLPRHAVARRRPRGRGVAGRVDRPAGGVRRGARAAGVASRRGQPAPSWRALTGSRTAQKTGARPRGTRGATRAERLRYWPLRCWLLRYWQGPAQPPAAQRMAHCRSPGLQPHLLVAGFGLAGAGAALLELEELDVELELVEVVFFGAAAFVVVGLGAGAGLAAACAGGSSSSAVPVAGGFASVSSALASVSSAFGSGSGAGSAVAIGATGAGATAAAAAASPFDPPVSWMISVTGTAATTMPPAMKRPVLFLPWFDGIERSIAVATPPRGMPPPRGATPRGAPPSGAPPRGAAPRGAGGTPG